MNQKFYIEDTTLPVSQDFEALKDEGLSFVQTYSKGEWTNFNPSDPGVTILDQVCYALTELGYCNDFPINDILTRPDGKLKIKNQFYLPEEILTTSPLTIDDYRKYLIDGMDHLVNVMFIAQSDAPFGIQGVYETYLYIDPSIVKEKQIEVVIYTAYYLLNKSRNLGEIFELPKTLNPPFSKTRKKTKPNKYLLKGKFSIADPNDLEQIIRTFQKEVNNYIFPEVFQSGYDSLKEEGEDTNEIFNGPLLVNGWIKTSSLGTKKDKIDASEIINILLKIAGVKLVPGLLFYQRRKTTSRASTHPSRILVIDIQKSIDRGLLEVWSNGKPLILKLSDPLPLEFEDPLIPLSERLKDTSTKIKPVASTVMSPPLPKGEFRDIDSYYSIQNTFPEVYAVGEASTPANASEFQIAQSRQLKGYLTLFDQVMANQFSQLANIDHLFSFDNSTSGTPSDRKKFYESKNFYQKLRLKYPVPYEVFSPTYFYQSLYEVPYIQPLLKNNEAHKFTYQDPSEQQLNQDSWNDYKEDPYNSYIWGLMNFVEGDADNLVRRNHMLNHLLSRYGYSPSLIDEIIEGSKYTRDALKDKIIYKSLFLQNLGLLSYNRQKAYNFFGARKIKKQPESIPVNYYQDLRMGYAVDFIFDTKKVNSLEKRQLTDFVNYSTLELQMSLLLGLRIPYEEYIIENTEISDDNSKIECSQQVKQAYWMITQRKGVIAIENNLLLFFIKCYVIISRKGQSDLFWKTDSMLNLSEIGTLKQVIREYNSGQENISLARYIRNQGLNYKLKKQNNVELKHKHFESISDSDFSIAIIDEEGKRINKLLILEDKPNIVYLFYPDFIQQFDTPAFERRLQLYLESFLPIQVQGDYYNVNTDDLKSLIRRFVAWHNSLIYRRKGRSPEKISVRAIALLRVIQKIQSKVK